MALAAKLQLRQAQSLVMTPQLMQSIKLLQLTHADLQAFIDQEIERNPLLERQDGEAPGEAGEADIAERGEATASEDWFESDAPPSSQAIAETMDSSLENVFPDDHGHTEPLTPELASSWKSGSTGSGAISEDLDIVELAAAALTLRDHVGQQIALSGLDPVANSIAWDMADSIDDAGYLRADIGETAERLGVDEAEVEAVLAVCQGFEPPGLFARDLAECLALQLKARDRFDPAMAALIENLELLARRDFVALRQICGVGQEDLTDMVTEIRALDPRPGFAFSRAGTPEAIIADVHVRQASDGSWAIELNSAALPRVLVDQTYFARVTAGANKEDKLFLTDCLQSANWLVRSLDQRAKTILKVASEIVRQQDGFLTHGVRHLRPMNLKTVAEAIGMHESTVSRVTSHKYMATPRGLFELRYFFTAAIQSAEGGEAHSSESVRDRIRELIDNEGGDVLSDDSIVEVLKRDGVDIARRTVAKYRESMNILSSVQRRREKRAMEAA